MHSARVRVLRTVAALLALAACALSPTARGQSPEVLASFGGNAPSGRCAFAISTPKTPAEPGRGNASGQTVAEVRAP